MDRRAAIRAYKETPRPMGVYQIRNLRDGRLLIGTSRDLPSILNRERTQLRLGSHRNAALQADWSALGPDAFAFEILDTIEAPEGVSDYDPAHDLATLEALWRERLSREIECGYGRRLMRA